MFTRPPLVTATHMVELELNDNGSSSQNVCYLHNRLLAELLLTDR